MAESAAAAAGLRMCHNEAAQAEALFGPEAPRPPAIVTAVGRAARQFSVGSPTGQVGGSLRQEARTPAWHDPSVLAAGWGACCATWEGGVALGCLS